MRSRRIKRCDGSWIIDATYHLGRATELVFTEPEAAKSLAGTASYLFLKEVQNCFDTKNARKLIEQGIKHIESKEPKKAYELFFDAKHLIEQGAEQVCKV